MGKWRTRYSRAPTGVLDDTTPTDNTLLPDEKKNGSMLDQEPKIKNEDIFWDKLEDVGARDVIGAMDAQEQTILSDPINLMSTNSKVNNGAVILHNKLDLASNCCVRSVNGFSEDNCNDEFGCEDDLNREEEEEFKCGIGPCTPRWMQVFATKQAFLVTFCIGWVLQGMYYTYFVSVITTIEKLFQIQSKTTGILMSSSEIGQIGSSLLLTYYCGQGHRPKWIAWGMVLFAVSSFASSLPHFLYGAQLMRSNDLLLSGVSSTSSDNTTDPILPNVCMSPMINESGGFRNESSKQDCNNIEKELIETKHTNVLLPIFFLSLLGVGMGQTAVYTLGIPYIDDNVAGRESPLYFAITIGVRILGPALGFLLGSLCTSLYADLSVEPQFTPTDPQWIGAWWLGIVIVSSLLMLTSFAMFAFPKQLNSNGQPRVMRRDKKSPKLKDFPKAVKRLLKNDILMLRTASSVLHILPIAGIYTFLPKYLETQFRLAAHSANMISGVGGILVMGLGIILSGIFILRVKPNARFVTAWIALTAMIYALGMGILMFFGCPMDDFAGLQSANRFGNGPIFKPVCDLSQSCDCDKDKFSPICGQDGKTYFSACHAGCRNITFIDRKIEAYSDCLCMNGSGNVSSIDYSPLMHTTQKIGYCDMKCDQFIWYIILFSIFVFIHSTSEVGSMLLILRCVDPRDKAMALGLIQFAIGLFGNVPCPVVYGAVVDSACLVWEMTCGEQGACWLYDPDMFRFFFHGTTCGILLCAFVVDIIVWFKADRIRIVDEPFPQQDEELNPTIGAQDVPRSETTV